MAASLTWAACNRGDDYAVLHPVAGLAADASLVSAICVVKRWPTDAAPVAGIPAKDLTTSFVAGVGQVLNVGDTVPANDAGYASPATQPYVYVIFSEAETASLASNVTYSAMIQVTDSNGDAYTSEVSRWPISPGITG